MDSQVPRRAPPAKAQYQGDGEESSRPRAQGLHVCLKVRDLVLEAAHLTLLRIVQYPDRVTQRLATRVSREAWIVNGEPPLELPVQPGLGPSAFLATKDAVADEDAAPIATTITVGAIARADVSQASGTPSAIPAAAESAAQIQSSSAVSPRTRSFTRSVLRAPIRRARARCARSNCG